MQFSPLATWWQWQLSTNWRGQGTPKWVIPNFSLSIQILGPTRGVRLVSWVRINFANWKRDYSEIFNKFLTLVYDNKTGPMVRWHPERQIMKISTVSFNKLSLHSTLVTRFLGHIPELVITLNFSTSEIWNSAFWSHTPIFCFSLLQQRLYILSETTVSQVLLFTPWFSPGSRVHPATPSYINLFVLLWSSCNIVDPPPIPLLFYIF